MKKLLTFFASIGVFLSGLLRAEPITTTKPLAIILMGPPGSGKGTNAEDLRDHFNIAHISTGDLFRENLKNNTPLGQKAKAFMEKGELVSDEVVISMVFDRLNKPDCKKGYILDGFPRTLKQANALDEYFKKNHIHPIVLNLKIDDGLIVERIINRLVCRNCGSCFNKIFYPPKVYNICDNCGGELYQRKDDTKDVVVERLHVYHSDTQPLLSYYSNKNHLYEINGNQSKNKVYDDLLEKILSAKR